MGEFYEKPHFTMDHFTFCEAEVRVENVRTKEPEGTPLREIWSNKSFGVCDGSGV